jgi:ABC-type sugar transport system ATPase subunit
MTAGKNIEFPLKLRRRSKNIIASETKHRIDELDIDASYLERLPRELPEGMKQLVAIAREKNHELEVFLMDEPMSHLDAAHHVHMRVFIQKIVRDLKKTTLISFNDPEDALAISDFIGVIEKGQLLQFGETWEVYHHPVNLTVMKMMARMGVNTLQVEIKNGYTIPFNIPADRSDGVYTMAFRPEEVKLAADGIPAKIRSSQFFDGKWGLMLCTLENGHTQQKVQLLLPKDTQGKLSFTTLEPQFFPVKNGA